MAHPDLRLPDNLGDPAVRAGLLQRFKSEVYGPLPPGIAVACAARPAQRADEQHLQLTLRHEGAEMRVDAGLWRPEDGSTRRVIIALDFLGPMGCGSADFPLDPKAVIRAPEAFGEADQLSELMRGATPHRVPVRLLTQAGYAVLVACYGSWTPDCPQRWRGHGTARLFPMETGALSLWAWALHRLVDVAVAQFCAEQIVLAGHSRLGKAALWAAVLDERVDAVFANQSGCFGAAPHAHPVGETAAQLVERFPHWVVAPGRPALDQHVLLSLIAPRRLYLGQARGDAWSDPVGSIRALRAIRGAWGGQGDPVGYHLRAGGHELLEEDWAQFLEFLARQCATP